MSDTLTEKPESTQQVQAAQAELIIHFQQLREANNLSPTLERWASQLQSDPYFARVYLDAKTRMQSGNAYPEDERFVRAIGIEVEPIDITEPILLGPILEATLDEMDTAQPTE